MIVNPEFVMCSSSVSRGAATNALLKNQHSSLATNCSARL